jgi:hypothetical protein
MKIVHTSRPYAGPAPRPTNPLAVGHYGTARGYVHSACALISSADRMKFPDDTPFILSTHMLLGFAMELYLKAALAHYGVTEAALKHSSRRHNLVVLHREVGEHGLHSNALRDLSSHFSARHGDFSYRYVDRAGTYVLMSPLQMFVLFSEADGCVDGVIGASSSLGTLRKSQNIWWVPPEHGVWRLPA